jgi:DNA-binding NarL/FixJ family response regulator
VNPIRVLIADDEPLARAGLALIVGAAADLTVVGEAATGPQTIERAAELCPDAVLLDIQMPGSDGIAVTRALRATPDPPRIVIITTFGLDDYLHRALSAGADGFLLKDAPAEAIQEAVRAAHRGEAVLSPRMTRRLIDRYTAGPMHDPTPPAGYAELTGREREVLRLIARGGSNAEIAGELFISEATVKTHVTRILMKLGMRDRAQTIVLAHRHGLTASD